MTIDLNIIVSLAKNIFSTEASLCAPKRFNDMTLYATVGAYSVLVLLQFLFYFSCFMIERTVSPHSWPDFAGALLVVPAMLASIAAALVFVQMMAMILECVGVIELPTRSAIGWLLIASIIHVAVPAYLLDRA